jgi:hypothetical protein
VTNYSILRGVALAILSAALFTTTASAHKLRVKGETVTVANYDIAVTPTRDWNRLSVRAGKNSETWTLDGEQLDDVTFYGSIEPGNALVRERRKKSDPLPKFTKGTLLIEIPELLEGTYRTHRDIASFKLLSTEPEKFLGHDGVVFTYEYTDADQLTRKGEAKAAIIRSKLYMMTFDAPRLHYYDQFIGDFRALANSATL